MATGATPPETIGVVVTRIDLSMPLFPGMPAFPGDPKFKARAVRSLARGNPFNLSLFEFGSHAGTHIDPPSHFVRGGRTVDRVPLDVLNGPCRVVRAPRRSRVIGVAEVASVPRGTSRLLLRTSNSERWARRLEFFPDYVGLSHEAAVALQRRGVRLLGIDSLSVERDSTGSFPVHHHLLGHGIVILEGLLLGGVAAGRYDLECLPLRVRGGDGGPARAAVRRL